MMIYETDLKQDKDGTWLRWIGEDEDGTKQKFRLGKDKVEARRRLRLIIMLFEAQSAAAEFHNRSVWVPEHLNAAKDIAKGRQARLPRLSLKVSETDFIRESAETYAKQLAILNRDGEVFQPGDPKYLTVAREEIEAEQKRIRIMKSKLLGTDQHRDPTGQNIGQAVDGFIDDLRTQNTIPDGSLSPWGKTQIDQMKSWKRFMSAATQISNGEVVGQKLLETDLCDLSVAKAQQMVDVIRKRPLTFESKQTRRMTCKSAQGINKKIRHFFDWLDLSDHWQWQEPPRFRKLNFSVASLTDEEKHDRKLKKEKWRLSDAEIQTIINYATPVERVLIILGLNCAFGAGEIGNLRVPYVKFETNEIDGIRFKTGNDTRHHLWPETIEALRWELQRRDELPKTEKSKDIFFLSETGGDPLWKKSKAGNYNNGVAKRWADLMKRVRKDHPTFHSYSFGKIRKTAAIRVIELADAEAASMILAHGIPTDDKILSAYVSIPWQKLYAAQETYGQTIRPLLKTERLPFEQPPKNYIGQKADQILEFYKKGISVLKISRLLELSVMTVYRHLDAAGLRK